MSKNLPADNGSRAGLWVVLVCVVAAGLYMSWIFAFQKDQLKDAQAYDEFSGKEIADHPRPEFSVKNATNEAALKAVLEWRGKVIPMVYEDGTLKLPASYDQNILPPYKLVLSEQIQPGKYHDITLTIEDQGKRVDALFEGFAPHDKVSMAFGTSPAFDKIPMDWSGRIDLNTVIGSVVPNPLCLQVFSQKSKLELCHAFANGWAT